MANHRPNANAGVYLSSMHGDDCRDHDRDENGKSLLIVRHQSGRYRQQNREPRNQHEPTLPRCRWSPAPAVALGVKPVSSLIIAHGVCGDSVERGQRGGGCDMFFDNFN
jgi:hypothetical protein